MADERDDDVSRRYRELGAAEPRAEVDRAVLAAAREATESPRAPLVAPGGRQRWYYSLAAAAVLVLAVGITVHLERERPDEEAPLQYQKKEAVQTPAPAAPSPRASQDALEKRSAPAAQARRKVERAPTFVPEPPPVVAQRADAEKQAAERATAEPAAPPAAAPSLNQAPVASTDQAPARTARPMLRSAPSAGVAPAPVPRGAEAPRQMAKLETPQHWLERIIELRSRGRHAEADQALAEFRRSYPNYKIPETMRERVEGHDAGTENR